MSTHTDTDPANSESILEVLYTTGYGRLSIEYFASDAEYEAWLSTGWRRTNETLDITRALWVHVGRTVRPLEARVAYQRRLRLSYPIAR
jgi:hypothetical protein